jgi:hypothetical protein
MTKQEEQRIMEGFRKSYSNFPDGQVTPEPPPLPDFVLTTAHGKRIGIELTEAFHRHEAKRRSAVKDQITDQLVESLRERLTFNFTFNIFLDERPLKKATMKKLILQLTDICVREFGTLANDNWGEVEHIDFDLSSLDAIQADRILQQGYRNLPPGIGRMRIHRYDRLPYSYNSKSEGGLVPNLTLEIIQPLLTKKEGLLSQQPPLDENWLLIREGNYFTGTFDRVHIQGPISSSFRKVFLFRTTTQEVIELK